MLYNSAVFSFISRNNTGIYYCVGNSLVRLQYPVTKLISSVSEKATINATSTATIATPNQRYKKMYTFNEHQICRTYCTMFRIKL